MNRAAAERQAIAVRTTWPTLSNTTTGVVFTLLMVQFVTGALLAFYYVPTADHAHTSILFLEKVLASGSWLRSLHHFGSQWLSLCAFIHVLRLFWQQAYCTSRGQWIASVLLLALVMAAGATGYSLPWDARAFFSTRVAEGLVGGLPLAGRMARLWLLGGDGVSTLTLSRFFALHVLITPFLILLILAARLSSANRGSDPSTGGSVFHSTQLRAQVIAGGVVFLALSLWSMKTPAPLGPAVAAAGPEYLPRPGAQFLWLYQTLKYLPGGLGSILGVLVPAVVIAFFISLPWLSQRKESVARFTGVIILSVSALLIVVMTTLSLVSDRTDQKTHDQLARQAAEEEVVRNSPFTPDPLNSAGAGQSQESGPRSAVPPAYTRLCASCHGANGEGARQGALKFPPLIDVSTKPRRTPEDIVGLLNDPAAYGLEPPMRSFATKLTDDEKREIANWVVTLRSH